MKETTLRLVSVYLLLVLSCLQQETALHCACRNVNIGAILLLLERGADPNALDQYSRTPLQTLAIKGNIALPLMSLLIPSAAFRDLNIPPVGGNELGINFSSSLYQTALSDVTFVLPGKSFPAHKIILCAQSPPFQR